jgi:hypothetical protein
MALRWDYDPKSGWDDLYDQGAEPWGHPGGRGEVRLQYHRHTMLALERLRAQNLVPLLGWDALTRVLVVQCGFGWMMEALNEFGVTQTKGTQLSSYIQGAKSNNEDPDLRTAVERVGLTHNEGDGLALFTTMRGDGGARARRGTDILPLDVFDAANGRTLRDAMGGNGFTAWTHDGFLNAMDDADAVALSQQLHRGAKAGAVIHHVYWPIGGIWNGKSPQDWKLLIPTDTFVVAGTYEVV